MDGPDDLGGLFYDSVLLRSKAREGTRQRHALGWAVPGATEAAREQRERARCRVLSGGLYRRGSGRRRRLCRRR